MRIGRPVSDSDGNRFAWTRFAAPRGVAVEKPHQHTLTTIAKRMGVSADDILTY
jgi:hypothetical protein